MIFITYLLTGYFNFLQVITLRNHFFSITFILIIGLYFYLGIDRFVLSFFEKAKLGTIYELLFYLRPVYMLCRIILFIFWISLIIAYFLSIID